MDITTLAQVGNIKVNEVDVIKAIRKKYIKNNFRHLSHIHNGDIIKTDDDRYEIHYSVFDDKNIDAKYIHEISDKEAEILMAFDVIINAIKLL